MNFESAHFRTSVHKLILLFKFKKFKVERSDIDRFIIIDIINLAIKLNLISPKRDTKRK